MSKNNTAIHDEWLEVGNHIRANYPIARSILAASFASPVCAALQHVNAYYHICAPALSGKTAMLRFAMSVWDDPSKNVFSYRSSDAKLMKYAEQMNPLPLALDDVQPRQKARLPKLVQMLSNFVTMEEMVQVLLSGEGSDEYEAPNQIIISTGRKMISELAPDLKDFPCLLEVKSELLETAFAHRVFLTANDDYGFAGAMFRSFFRKHRSDLIRDYNEVLYTLKEIFGRKTIALENAGMIALADFYSGISVFREKNERKAWREAIELGREIMTASKR